MKRLATPALVLVVICLPLTGCFKHTFQIGTGSPEGEIVYKNWHHHWLFGLIRPERQKKLDLEKFCASGNATIHEEQSFVNGLIAALIGFIYAPTTVTIRCDDGTAAEVELTGEQVARLVHDPLFLVVVEQMAPERLLEVQLALANPAEEPAQDAVTARAE